MSGYSESALTSKLCELNGSAPSIQGVSLWLIHHRKHYKNSVQVWYRELAKQGMDRKLTLLYLANDVVQNTRKKFPEVGKEFGSFMVSVFTHLSALDLDRKTVGSIGRLVNIWRERQIFESKVLQEVSSIWAARLESDDIDPPAKKARKEERTVKSDSGNSDALHKNNSVTPVPGSDLRDHGGEEGRRESGFNNLDQSKESECRRSLELALQMLAEVERAEREVETCSVPGELTQRLAGELLARSRLSQLVAGVLARQQEKVGEAEVKLAQAREQKVAQERENT